MTPPKSYKFVKNFFYKLALSLLQRNYINFTLFPNAFELNLEITT